MRVPGIHVIRKQQEDRTYVAPLITGRGGDNGALSGTFETTIMAEGEAGSSSRDEHHHRPHVFTAVLYLKHTTSAAVPASHNFPKRHLGTSVLNWGEKKG